MNRITCLPYCLITQGSRGPTPARARSGARRLALLARAAGAALVVLCVSTLFAQQIARDRMDAPTAVGNALVSGTIVTDESSPQPVRRALVTLTSSEAAVQKTTQTDASGRFTLAGVPAGRYTLAANKPGYVRVAYGARRFDRPGTPITLTDGQQMTGVSLKMPRGSVISGVILDENGAPVFGVQVRVMQYRMQAGTRTLAPVAMASLLGETTDDRGAYRLFGLPPGEYIVSATPRMGTVGEIRAMTEAEIRSALAALQQPVAPNPAVPGAGPTAAANSAPPAKRDSGTTVGFAPVYYPGTLSAAAAATVTVGAGEERNGVDFALQLVKTAKIEGAIVAPAGVPLQSVTLTLVPGGPAGLAGGLGPILPTSRASVGPDGKFSYTAIPPGQYTITARAARPAGGAGAGPGPQAMAGPPVEMGFRIGGTPGAALDQLVTNIGGSGAAYWAMTDVTVDGSPLSNVVLTLQPGMTLSGRIEFSATRATPAPELNRVRVTLAPAPAAGGGGISLGLPVAQVDPAGKFTVTGVTPGRYRLNGIAPSPAGTGPGQTWTLKSAIVKGRDVLDFPLDIGPGEEVGDAVLTFTDASQQVSGVLQDPTGRPAPDYTIVVFAADSKYWAAPSRRIRTVRPGTDGRFTVTNLPTGDYRIAALVDIAPNEANDPAFLQQLVAASYQFTLGEGERKVQDLRITGGN